MEVFIVDPDHRRRAQLANDLQREGVFATPVDPSDAPITARNGVALVLCHDAGSGSLIIANPISHIPVEPILVYYSDEVCLRDVVRALRASVVEYFEWPNDRQEMIAFVKRTIAATAGGSAHEVEQAAYRLSEAPQDRNGRQTLQPKPSTPAGWLGEFVRKSDARQRLNCLSMRELEVLRLVVSGLSSNAIAKNLGISPRTVESHRAHIFSKTETHTTAEIVRYAIEGGIA